VIGNSPGNKLVNYEFSAFQPFVGLYTYEVDPIIYGVGVYEDDCHNKPKKDALPFGMGEQNLPSLEEITGKTSETALTWINEDHGKSTLEV